MSLLFSGTIFYADSLSHLQVEQIPWSREATYRLPLTTWKRLMYRSLLPNSTWLCLPKPLFDRLEAYRSRHGVPTWDLLLEGIATSLEQGEQR